MQGRRPVRDERRKSRRRPQRTVMMIVLIGVALLLGVLVAVPPIVMKDMIAGPILFERVYTAEQFGLSAQTLRLQTSDGLSIAAYEVQAPEPKAVVIFLSGIHNPSVTAFFGHSRMLLEHGYASVLVEMRARGDSEGNLISLGFGEYLDMLAAVDYVKGEARYQDVPVVAYGLSMGGSTAINAMAHSPQIDGLVSLSAYSSWEDVFVDNMIRGGAPRFFGTMQKPFVRAYTTLRFGLSSFNNRPVDNITKLGERPALLVHSKDDSQIPWPSYVRLAAAAPDHVETWVREGDLHFIVATGLFLTPEEDQEYYGRIIEFLDQHFGR